MSLELELLEQSIQNARKHIERGAALQRLMKNKDFKEIILKGFFEEEAIRLVHLKSDSEMQTAERQASVLRDMDAIGTLSGYLRGLQRQAAIADKQLAADESFREELLAEEVAV